MCEIIFEVGRFPVVVAKIPSKEKSEVKAILIPVSDVGEVQLVVVLDQAVGDAKRHGGVVGEEPFREAQVLQVIESSDFLTFVGNFSAVHHAAKGVLDLNLSSTSHA